MLPAAQPSHRTPSPWSSALALIPPEAPPADPPLPDNTPTELLPLSEVRRDLASLPGWRLARRGQALAWSRTFPDRPSAARWAATVLVTEGQEEPVPVPGFEGASLTILLAEPGRAGITSRALAKAGRLAGLESQLLPRDRG